MEYGTRDWDDEDRSFFEEHDAEYTGGGWGVPETDTLPLLQEVG